MSVTMIEEKIEQFVKEMFITDTDKSMARQLLRRVMAAELSGLFVEFALDALEIDIGGVERWEFKFEGEETECKLARAGIPHIPHIVGFYSIPPMKKLQYYCMGKPGTVNLGGVSITVEVKDVMRVRGGATGKVRVEVKA